MPYDFSCCLKLPKPYVKIGRKRAFAGRSAVRAGEAKSQSRGLGESWLVFVGFGLDDRNDLTRRCSARDNRFVGTSAMVFSTTKPDGFEERTEVAKTLSPKLAMNDANSLWDGPKCERQSSTSHEGSTTKSAGTASPRISKSFGWDPPTGA